MRLSSYNVSMGSKKLSPQDILKIQSSISLIEPKDMSPEDRTSFINGVMLDYENMKKEAKRDKTLIKYTDMYAEVLSHLVKTFGH